MSRRTTRSRSHRPRHADAAAVQDAIEQTFTPAVVDQMRELTGYNPRQRIATAQRLMLAVVEAFLLGQTLSFAAVRAVFMKRFGFIRSCPLQKRFKQRSAVAFFKLAIEQLVTAVAQRANIDLGGPLRSFSDVRIYDATTQRVPPRGRSALPACTPGKAGVKWLLGYSIKTGLVEHATCAAETASETPLWRTLVPQLERGVLYLFDLGFFERRLFRDARAAGAHVLMRLKSSAKVHVVGHVVGDRVVSLPNWSLGYYLKTAPRRFGTVFDLDVVWGPERDQAQLRLVGIVHRRKVIRWYLTTVPRSTMSAKRVVHAYRLRWLVELLFRELKQNVDLGRAFTGDENAVKALTYGAMLGHVLVRSLRIHAALQHDVPVEQLRPLASLRQIRAYADDLIDALASGSRVMWRTLTDTVANAIVLFAREPTPSRSRPRIALRFGAVGA